MWLIARIGVGLKALHKCVGRPGTDAVGFVGRDVCRSGNAVWHDKFHTATKFGPGYFFAFLTLAVAFNAACRGGNIAAVGDLVGFRRALGQVCFRRHCIDQNIDREIILRSGDVMLDGREGAHVRDEAVNILLVELAVIPVGHNGEQRPAVSAGTGGNGTEHLAVSPFADSVGGDVSGIKHAGKTHIAAEQLTSATEIAGSQWSRKQRPVAGTVAVYADCDVIGKIFSSLDPPGRSFNGNDGGFAYIGKCSFYIGSGGRGGQNEHYKENAHDFKELFHNRGVTVDGEYED